MTRIPYDVGGEGKRLNLHRVLAHSAGADRVHAVAYYLRFESSIEPRLREMAILQVGYATRCRYEYLHHVEIALRFGVSEDDIRSIADDSNGTPTGLDPLTRAVLAAARETALQRGVSDETFALLRDALSDEQIVDLVLAMSFYTFTVCVLRSLDIDVEPEYEELARRFPLPAD